MKALLSMNRIASTKNKLAYIRRFDDFPVFPISNVWTDTLGQNQFGGVKIYAVQTALSVVKRCLLMTTDPGDLVFDPTCGSGTTALVAENWGRRWITCDTSRVAIALAKQRLMTAKFEYFTLAHSDEGIKSGFNYGTVPHITLSSIANHEPPSQEVLFDRPIIDKSKVRVTGPFTVEAVPCLRVLPLKGKDEPPVTEDTATRTGAAASYARWMDELRASGIRGIKGQTIAFTRLEPLFGTQWLQAEGETSDGKRTIVCFGPDFGPLEQRQVEMALKEVRALEHKPEIIVFAAFQFDPEAGKDIDLVEWKGVQVLKAQMSADLFTSDLRKKKSSNQSYWLIGQPDIVLEKTKDGKCTVTVNGFDYYDPSSGEVQSHGAEKIAMWLLDTDYDDQSLLPDQVFFPMKDIKRDWTPLAKALNGAVDVDLLEAYTGLTSLPFSAGENEKIAVKIVDDRGIESLVIKSLS
jgi:adenine-specific DNA-methyltransferase